MVMSPTRERRVTPNDPTRQCRVMRESPDASASGSWRELLACPPCENFRQIGPANVRLKNIWNRQPPVGV